MTKIVVEQSSDTIFEARIAGSDKPTCPGTTLQEAVGDLLISYPDECGVQIEVRDRS